MASADQTQEFVEGWNACMAFHKVVARSEELDQLRADTHVPQQELDQATADGWSSCAEHVVPRHRRIMATASANHALELKKRDEKHAIELKEVLADEKARTKQAIADVVTQERSFYMMAFNSKVDELTDVIRKKDDNLRAAKETIKRKEDTNCKIMTTFNTAACKSRLLETELRASRDHFVHILKNISMPDPTCDHQTGLHLRLKRKYPELAEIMSSDL